MKAECCAGIQPKAIKLRTVPQDLESGKFHCCRHRRHPSGQRPSRQETTTLYFRHPARSLWLPRFLCAINICLLGESLFILPPESTKPQERVSSLPSMKCSPFTSMQSVRRLVCGYSFLDRGYFNCSTPFPHPFPRPHSSKTLHHEKNKHRNSSVDEEAHGV